MAKMTAKQKAERNARDLRAALTAIASEQLGIETLEDRNRDCLDFHDVGVAGLRAALEDAYNRGRVDHAEEEPCGNCGR